MSGGFNLIDEVNKWFKATLAGRAEEAEQIKAQHFAEEQASVDVEISPLTVTYHITGHAGPAGDLVRMIFEKYPQAGYGTRIVSQTRKTNRQRLYSRLYIDDIVVQRYLSCE